MLKYSQDNRWPIGVAFTLPLIAGLLVLTIYPVVSSFYFSLCDYPTINPSGPEAPTPTFIGVGNYNEMLHDPRFWLSLWNTAYFAIFAVPLGMVVGLLLALLLNLNVKGMAFY